jgi:hypothetical protein
MRKLFGVAIFILIFVLGMFACLWSGVTLVTYAVITDTGNPSHADMAWADAMTSGLKHAFTKDDLIDFPSVFKFYNLECIRSNRFVTALMVYLPGQNIYLIIPHCGSKSLEQYMMAHELGHALYRQCFPEAINAEAMAEYFAHKLTDINSAKLARITSTYIVTEMFTSPINFATCPELKEYDTTFKIIKEVIAEHEARKAQEGAGNAS